MASHRPRVLVGDEDCLPAAVAGILYHPVHLEESLPREVPPAVTGVPGGPPARREVAGPGDLGGGGGHHWAIPLIRSSFGGLHSISEDTKRVKYPEDLYCSATGGRSATNL